jgi:hypothetical protein
MKKIRNIKDNTKQFREIFIQALEQLIIDIRDGRIEMVLAATINHDKEIGHLLFCDKAKEDSLKIVGLAAEILREQQDVLYG